MLISREMNDLMNAQTGREFGASLQYVEVAAYFEGAGLPGLSQFFLKQSNEERDHAMRFVRYILDAGGQVAIPAVDAPKAEFSSSEEAVKLARESEMAVTRQINTLLDRATSERDYIAHDFLEWFAREQLEEVSSMDTLLRMVQRAGEQGMMLVDSAVASGRALTAGPGPREE